MQATERYLELLRQGDYLGALQWLKCLVEHYSVADCDADTLLQLAIFELVQHGFSSDDFLHIELLYTLLYEQVPPFVEQIGYYATVFCNAAMQCLVFEENDLLKFYKTPQSLDAKAINEWMQRNPPEFDSAKNSSLLMEKFTALDKSVFNLKKQAQIIRNKINYILQCQATLKEYVIKLANSEDKEGFYPVRQGLINSLYSFIMEKTMITPDVIETLNCFAEKVLKMEPYPWEKEILEKLIIKNKESFFSSFFDLSAGKLQFFVVKVISSILPVVEGEHSEHSPRPE
ncbi:helical bundle domain-containing protein [Legionella jamestowniensis]|uniref:Uncharacterized protein n=1 Tax=Legionella jamestowniensis TaxID=455 RepID=A0A0W0UJL8_9GAMM|nr:helical bundle domain-containing protein [Legionella jamestowniensis]KTD08068.1 hypothetical protein Ljam_2263 [Legionella jamestowniensis]SFM05744.1 hypothetical protein SAMN02746073_0169 [Legionella jamestowniensis DSM 19215]